MKKKKFVFVAILLPALLIFAACSYSGNYSGSGGGVIVLEDTSSTQNDDTHESTASDTGAIEVYSSNIDEADGSELFGLWQIRGSHTHLTFEAGGAGYRSWPVENRSDPFDWSITDGRLNIVSTNFLRQFESFEVVHGDVLFLRGARQGDMTLHRINP